MFSIPTIKGLMNKYTLVQLYTDRVPAHYDTTTSAAENLNLLRKQFGTAQLPTYIILKPLGGDAFQELSRYDEGKINNVQAFAAFLERPLAKSTDAKTLARNLGAPSGE